MLPTITFSRTRRTDKEANYDEQDDEASQSNSSKRANRADRSSRGSSTLSDEDSKTSENYTKTKEIKIPSSEVTDDKIRDIIEQINKLKEGN